MGFTQRSHTQDEYCPCILFKVFQWNKIYDFNLTVPDSKHAYLVREYVNMCNMDINGFIIDYVNINDEDAV